MFLIDETLFFLNPIWIAEKLREIALKELEDTPEKLKKELLELQQMLEVGRISEKLYFKREKNILERLNALQQKVD